MHGDIKLSNVAVDEAMRVFVLDVETVVRLSGRTFQRVPKGFRFTEGYAAPELAKKNKVCSATDLFSLGVIIAELADKVTFVRAVR